uniref:Uncharacterized protein n=1 Tax=Mycena chlorophos TaxID=658473 RepID=A0ABQ0M7P3_MYCCL|nr:predicted protein [Mycena chlorophos]
MKQPVDAYAGRRILPAIPKLPPRPDLSHIRIHDATTNEIRDVTDDAAFLTIKTLLEDVVSHLIGSYSAPITILSIFIDIAPFFSGPSVSELSQHTDVIVELLRNRELKFVVRDLGANDEWTLLDGTERNRLEDGMSISADLCATLREDAMTPPYLTAEQRERLHLYHRVMFCLIAMHELVQLLSQMLFSPTFIPPRYHLLLGDGEGNADLGSTFHRNYMGFRLEMWFLPQDAPHPDRLWRVHELVARGSPDSPSKRFILDAAIIQKILQSLQTDVIVHVPRPKESKMVRATSLGNRGGYVRYSLRALQGDEEEDEESSDSDEESARRGYSYKGGFFVVTNGCGRRT